MQQIDAFHHGIHCKGKKYLQTKDYNIFFKKKYNLTRLDICTMNYPKLIVSNQKEESISIQRVCKKDI